MAETGAFDSLYQPVPLPPPVGGVVNTYPADLIQDNQLASASNFVIRDGVVTQRKGYETLIGASGAFVSTPYTLTEWIPYNQSPLIVVATLTSLHYYDSAGDAWPDITGTARTGTINNPVFFTPMRTASAGLRLITVNGADPPSWWSGATSSTFTYVQTAVIGACATVWRSHFLQGDVTTTADGRVAARIQWSALGDPTTHSGTASTGTLDLLDANGTRVNCFAPLRGNLVAYKEESAHVLIYKASPFYFTQSLLHASLTTISRRAVAPVFNGDQHVVVTKENIILWDGQNLDRIGDGIQQDFYTNLNWDAVESIWAAYSPLTEEVLIGVPVGSATLPNKLWIYNLRYNSWWPCDLDFLAAVPVFNVWSPPRLVGIHPGAKKIYQLFSGFGDGSGATAVVASLQTKMYDFGAAPSHKGVKQVVTLLGVGTGTTTTVSVTKAVSETPVGTITFATAHQNTITFTGGTKEPKADGRITGKYVGFRLQHSAASETVQVHRIVPYVEQRTPQRKDRS